MMHEIKVIRKFRAQRKNTFLRPFDRSNWRTETCSLEEGLEMHPITILTKHHTLSNFRNPQLLTLSTSQSQTRQNGGGSETLFIQALSGKHKWLLHASNVHLINQ